ncbi:MAG TPA: chemotaxis protein CheC [Anaerolineales bacterium]|nr:chemotaxis protein CheC [Anaerolineales bacterium]
MDDSNSFDQELLELLQKIAAEGIHNAANGFSGMIGRKIQFSKPVAKLVPVLTIPKIVGKGDDDAVGIYLRFQGDLAGQIMMIVSYQKALELADLLMEVPAGTTQHLGSLERSALGELGNLCGSFFLNSVAKVVTADFRPSPPAVMVDMVGAILDVVVVTTGGISEHALMMQTNFMDGSRIVEADFWVIPDMNSLNDLIEKNSSHERD